MDVYSDPEGSKMYLLSVIVSQDTGTGLNLLFFLQSHPQLFDLRVNIIVSRWPVASKAADWETIHGIPLYK